MILAREEPINGACQKAPKFIKDADGDRLFVKKIKDMVIRKHRRTWLHNVEDSIMEHTAPKTELWLSRYSYEFSPSQHLSLLSRLYSGFDIMALWS